MPSDSQIQDALLNDKLIDIVTKGAKSGKSRCVEIWFTNVNGRIIICGTPDSTGENGPQSKRGWLANLKTNPAFLFCFKESINIRLPARAVEITDPADRRFLMSAPETRWYRERVDSIDQLVEASPIVEVFFE